MKREQKREGEEQRKDFVGSRISFDEITTTAERERGVFFALVVGWVCERRLEGAYAQV